MDGNSDESSSPLTPPSPSKLSVLGSAIASFKSYFTPERVARPHFDGAAPSIGITPLTKDFAGLSINDSHNSTDSFRTSKSVVDDDSFVSSNSFADASDHDSSNYLRIDPETPYDPDATVLNEGTIIEGSNASRFSDSNHDFVEECSQSDPTNFSLEVSDEGLKEPQKSESPLNSVLNITPLLEVTMNQAPSPCNNLEKSIQEPSTAVEEPTFDATTTPITEFLTKRSPQVPKLDSAATPTTKPSKELQMVQEPSPNSLEPSLEVATQQALQKEAPKLDSVAATPTTIPSQELQMVQEPSPKSLEPSREVATQQAPQIEAPKLDSVAARVPSKEHQIVQEPSPNSLEPSREVATARTTEETTKKDSQYEVPNVDSVAPGITPQEPVQVVPEPTPASLEPSREVSTSKVSEENTKKSSKKETAKLNSKAPPSVTSAELHPSHQIEEPKATSPVSEDLKENSSPREATACNVPTSPEVICLSPDETILLSSSPEIDPLKKSEIYDPSDSVICIDMADLSYEAEESAFINESSKPAFKEHLEDSEIILNLPQDVTTSLEESTKIQEKPNFVCTEGKSAEMLAALQNSGSRQSAEKANEVIAEQLRSEMQRFFAGNFATQSPVEWAAHGTSPKNPKFGTCKDFVVSTPTDDLPTSTPDEKLPTCVCDTNEVMLEPVNGSPAGSDENAEVSMVVNCSPEAKDAQNSSGSQDIPAHTSVDGQDTEVPQAEGTIERDLGTIWEEELQKLKESQKQSSDVSNKIHGSPWRKEPSWPEQKCALEYLNGPPEMSDGRKNLPQRAELNQEELLSLQSLKDLGARLDRSNEVLDEMIDVLLPIMEEKLMECSFAASEEVSLSPGLAASEEANPSPRFAAPEEVSLSPGLAASEEVNPSPGFAAPEKGNPSPCLSTPEQVNPSSGLAAQEEVNPSADFTAPEEVNPSPGFVPPARPITFTEEPMEVSFNTSTKDHYEISFTALESGVVVQAVDAVPPKIPVEADKSDEETISANSSGDSFDSQLTAKTLEEVASRESAEDEPVPPLEKFDGTIEDGVYPIEEEIKKASGSPPEKSEVLDSVPNPETVVSVSELATSLSIEDVSMSEPASDGSQAANKTADASCTQELPPSDKLELDSSSPRNVCVQKAEDTPEINKEPSTKEEEAASAETRKMESSEELKPGAPPKIKKASLPIPTVSIIPATPERERSEDEIVFVPRDIPAIPLVDTTVDFGADRTTIVFSPSAAESTRIQEDCFSPNQTTFDEENLQEEIFLPNQVTFVGENVQEESYSPNKTTFAGENIQEENYSPNQTTFAGEKNGVSLESGGDMTFEEPCVTDAAALIRGQEQGDESSPEVSICANFTHNFASETFAEEVNATLDGVQPLEKSLQAKSSSTEDLSEGFREDVKAFVEEIVLSATEKVQKIQAKEVKFEFSGSQSKVYEKLEEFQALAKNTVDAIALEAVEKALDISAKENLSEVKSPNLEEIQELANNTIDAIALEAVETALNIDSEKNLSVVKSPNQSTASPAQITLHGFSFLEKEASPAQPNQKTPIQDDRGGLLIDASPLVLHTIQQKKEARDLLSETIDFNQSVAGSVIKSDISSLKLIDASPFVLHPAEKQARDLLSETLEEVNPSAGTETKKLILESDLESLTPLSGRLLNFENSVENEEEQEFAELEESVIFEDEEDEEKLMLSTIAEVTEISMAEPPSAVTKEETVLNTTPLGTLKGKESWDSPVDTTIKHNVESTPLHPAITRVLNECNVSVSPISNGHESQTDSLLNAAMLEGPSTSEFAGTSNNEDKNVSGAKSMVSFNVSPMAPIEEPVLEEVSLKEDAENVFKMPKKVGKLVKNEKTQKDCTIFVGSVVAESKPVVKPKEEAKVVVVAPFRNTPTSENECVENAVLPNKPAVRKSSTGILREINENVILEDMGAVLGTVKDVSELKNQVKTNENLLESREAILLQEIERLKECYRQREEEQKRLEEEHKKKLEEIEKSIREGHQKLAEAEQRNKKYEQKILWQQTTFQQSHVICQELKKSAEKARTFVESMETVPPGQLESAQVACESAKQHVASAESAFIDVHSKFETLKSKIPVIKKSILEGEREVIDLRRQKAVTDEKVRAAEAQALAELDEMGMAISEEKERFLGESTRIGAQLRKAELVAKTTQESLDKITIDNERLSNLCDDIIAGKT